MGFIKANYERRIQDDDVELIVSFDNEETGLLSLLFNGELDNFYDWIYESVMDSLSNSKQVKIAGNICELQISKDFTLIYDLISDDDCFLKIETLILKELMCEWKKEFDDINS